MIGWNQNARKFGHVCNEVQRVSRGRNACGSAECGCDRIDGGTPSGVRPTTPLLLVNHRRRTIRFDRRNPVSHGAGS